MASLVSPILLYSSATQDVNSRNTRRVSNPSSSIVSSRDQRSNLGSRVGGIVRPHFGRGSRKTPSLPPPCSCKVHSSMPVRRSCSRVFSMGGLSPSGLQPCSRVYLSMPIIHSCSRIFSMELALPTNARRGDESVSSGTILGGPDRLSSAKLQSIVAKPDILLNTNRLQVEQSTLRTILGGLDRLASAEEQKIAAPTKPGTVLDRFQVEHPTHGSTLGGGWNHLSSAKEQCISARTKPDTLLNRFQVEDSTAKHSVWKALQRGVGLILASAILACTCLPGAAHSLAENSIGASSLGLKVADFLRGSGLSDELVVLIVGMLPVLELRGAIPISYWLKIEPVKGYLLSVFGNMIPVPFIVLYLEKILATVGGKGKTGQNFVRWVVERTRKQAGPIEEFEWLGLLLFVAVPLPGTGAWSGAIAASILGMPFWDAVTANFVGVLLAGLLVTLLVTVGTKEAVLVGIALFLSSGFLWSALRLFQKKRGKSST